MKMAELLPLKVYPFNLWFSSQPTKQQVALFMSHPMWICTICHFGPCCSQHLLAEQKPLINVNVFENVFEKFISPFLTILLVTTSEKI